MVSLTSMIILLARDDVITEWRTTDSYKNTEEYNASTYIHGIKHKTDATPKMEKRHIAFLKVHKAASSTVQNILYRFGSKRNLSFVLPYNTHYISQNAQSYNPVLPPNNKTEKYDILCNHAMFNYTKFRQFMYDDAFYLAIVREPLDLFISSAWYYRYVWSADYLKKINEETFIHDLITDPEDYETKTIRNSRTFNYMAHDFGFEMDSIEDVKAVNDSTVAMFITDLMSIFDFVMVVEYFDESLVMLKRYLNWSIKDILYIKQNAFVHGRKHVKPIMTDVSDEDKDIFKKRNRLDYAVYEAFRNLFLKQRSEQKGLDEEVREFKTTLEEVKTFCNNTHSNTSSLFSETNWSSGFMLDRHDCRAMMTDELAFWKELVHEHRKIS